MRRRTIGLGLLLGAASVAVVGAAAIVLPHAFGADTETIDVAGIAAPAQRDASPTTRTGSSTAVARSGNASRFHPGYRRVSRKRVQPKKKQPATWIAKCGLYQLRSFFKSASPAPGVIRYTVSFGTQNAAPLQLVFQDAERIKAAAELRKLSVEDRLARAEEKLGLTPGQMELLRRAAAGAPEAGLGVEAGAVFDARVKQALNDEQQRRWAKEGYGDSFRALIYSGLLRTGAAYQIKASSFVYEAKPATAGEALNVRVVRAADNVVLTLNGARTGTPDDLAVQHEEPR